MEPVEDSAIAGTSQSKRRSSIMRLFGFSLVLVSLSALPTGAQEYSVTEILGLPGGYDLPYPTDINDLSHVVGTAVGTRTARGFGWKNGMTTPLLVSSTDVLQGGALGINLHGDIVGFEQTETQSRAIVWRGDAIVDLGTIPPYIASAGDRINNRGEVVGRLPTASGADPFLWSNGVIQPLRDPTGGEQFVHVADINNDGVVLGNTARTESAMRGLLWRDGVTTVLDDLPGGTGWFVPTGVWSEPHALNDGGEVVGVSDGANGIHAFLWRRPGEIIDLGAIRGNSSDAKDINNNGVVVGFTGGGDPHAFVWDSLNGMRDLNDLLDDSGAGWTLRKATAINNQRQIVGFGEFNGEHAAFLLTPIPEPSTFVTAAVALMCAAIIPALRSLLRKGGIVVS